MTAGPLAGIRVIEMAGIGPGPLCGMLLADLGAEVILVERELPPGDAGRIVDTGLLRRNRRSVVLDLKASGSTDAVIRLAATADAFFEGWRPGVAERLGIGPDVLLAANPRLVYGRMTGWGQDGPLAPRAGHDINYLALTGALHAIGREQPTPPLNLAADFGGGAMFLALGLLAGVLHARATGEGQVVDAGMVDGVHVLMAMFRDLLDRGQWTDDRQSNLIDGGAPFMDTYRCADGGWVALGAMEPQFRRELFTRLGLPFEDADLGLDPARWPALRERLEGRIAEHPRDHWAALFADSDACVSPVLSIAEAPSHAHARARGSFTTTASGGWQPRPAPRFGATPAADPADPPERGADTEVVLRELGLSEPAARR